MSNSFGVTHRITKEARDAVPFLKMHGAGNDFVVFDGRRGLAFDPGQLAPAITDRHFGIGADGVLVLETSRVADFGMSYYNADGSASTCGNGMRCIARFIVELGLLGPEQKDFDLETVAGNVQIRVFGRGERSRVDMGPPTFEGFAVPTEIGGEHIERSLTVDGQEIAVTAVGMGNPHCVIFVPDIQTARVTELGPMLERHSFFPERTNVEFVQVIDRRRVRMRIWERGVGETLACGTGICAAAAALVRTDRCERQMMVEVPGGELEAHWDVNSGHMRLTGPAETVFCGEFAMATLST